MPTALKALAFNISIGTLVKARTIIGIETSQKTLGHILLYKQELLVAELLEHSGSEGNVLFVFKNVYKCWVES